MIQDPSELTPVQELPELGLWLKRDDLFTFGGALGSKARAAVVMLRGAKGCVVAGSRLSPMVSRVARVAAALGVPCRAHVAPSKELSLEELDAVTHGAELVKHRVGYLTALKAYASRDAAALGWTEIPFGFECATYVEQSRRQAANLPREAKRVVVTVGSGMALSAVLWGLRDQGLSQPVLGVLVGSDPIERIDRWAPPGWRARVELIRARQKFEVSTPAQLGAVELDPHYESKLLPFLRRGDAVWLVACRATLGTTREALMAKQQTGSVSSDEGPPAWALGYPVPELKAQTAVFKAHDRGLVLGAFSGVKDRDLAEWRRAGELRVVEGGLARVVKRKARTAVPDFCGRPCVEAFPGSLQVCRLAWTCQAGRERLFQALQEELRKRERPRAIAEGWMEHPEEPDFLQALGFRWMGSKITAASEVRGLFELGPQAALPPPPAYDVATLTRLDLAWPTIPNPYELGGLADLAEERLVAWADHYAAAYNKGHTWKAVALRGFGGRVDFIEKPAEMSKAWKEANPEKLAWELADTPLRAALPELEPLINAVPGVKHRVRLMLLQPGGTIGRHADITDPSGGTGFGQTMRIHVPLASDPACLFFSWDAQGRKHGAHFAPGTVWYLDTRKPHAVEHRGTARRIHLVMDVEANEPLFGLLREEAPVLP